MAASRRSVETGNASLEDDDSFVYVFDRREGNSPEIKIPTGGLFSFTEFKHRVNEALGLTVKDEYVIATTNREEIHDDMSWDMIDKGDTLYVLWDLEQDLCAPAQERVNYLPHYDTIVKGGMYEYYASEGQNPMPYALAELLDNALAATANNIAARNIEIRLHFDDSNPSKNSVYVIDNGKGMTPRHLNNWAIYRLSKFIRRDKRGRVSLNGSEDILERSMLHLDSPRSLNSDISYFGVGGKQAIFFIGNTTRMISRPKGSKDVHELTISKDEFEKKEKNHEAIYSGYIRNRKAGDYTHVSEEDEILRKIISEEIDRESFTVVVIQGINQDHVSYLKQRTRDWTRQLAHIYHFYIHGPNGNMTEETLAATGQRVPTPFKNIDIQVKMFNRGQTLPKIINLRDIDDDMQTAFVRSSAATFDFKAIVENVGVVEGVLRYHPFLYDRETYPMDITDARYEPEPDDDHMYAINDRPARGRRPIFECYWNGRLIPYSLIEYLDWCAVPKKLPKNIRAECYNRISGVLWTNDKFQVSTNKLTFIDLEMRLRDKTTWYSKMVGFTEKRTNIEKEFQNWLRDCHEQFDKQIHFAGNLGAIVRTDLPKHKQTPWVAFKSVEWDRKVYKRGQLVKILRTIPMLLGTIKTIMLYGEHEGDVFATGGELEVIQEPRSLYDEVKIVPLSKLDRSASDQMIKKFIEDEEAKLPDRLHVTWPDGFPVVQNEKRPAGKTIGNIKIEIMNKRGETISKLPGTGAASKKLLVELKVVWHSLSGNETICSHISQHGKNWPYWFRKMENIKNLGNHSLILQAVLNESGANMYAGKELPSEKIKFVVTEAEPEKFTVGLLDGPFRVGLPFQIPLEFLDEFNNPTKPTSKLKPVLQASGLDISYENTLIKGSNLILKGIVARGTIGTTTGKNFNLIVSVPGLETESQTLKIRLLPGHPSSLSVSPKEQIEVENGNPVAFTTQVLDEAGNVTASDNKPLILLCKFVGQLLTAKIDLQGYKDVKTVERNVLVKPSNRVANIYVWFTDGDEQLTIKKSQTIAGTCGEHVRGLGNVQDWINMYVIHIRQTKSLQNYYSWFLTVRHPIIRLVQGLVNSLSHHKEQHQSTLASRHKYHTHAQSFSYTSYIVEKLPKRMLNPNDYPLTNCKTFPCFQFKAENRVFTVKIMSEDENQCKDAKASHLSMKLWRLEPGSNNSPPAGPEPTKANDGIFKFRDKKVPEQIGKYNVMFVYYDGKHQLFSEVITISVKPGPPFELVSLEPPGTPTVSNTRNTTTRVLIRSLRLELRDQFGNSTGGGYNGKVHLTIMGPKDVNEIPHFIGGTRELVFTMTNSICQIQNLLLQESTPGKDGQEYTLRCELHCDIIPRNKVIDPFDIPFLFFNDAKKQSQMAALSKERDHLQNAIGAYKSLFETSQQLINELKVSVRDAQQDEDRIRDELRKYKIPGNHLQNVNSVDECIKIKVKEQENLMRFTRRHCGLGQAPKDPEVLGKIGHLALVEEVDIARVMSWHMSADMDCVVTLTTKKAKEVYNQTSGRQQVLPLDSIYRKNLPDWSKPLPHIRFRANWRPPGHPVYARALLQFPENEDKCKIVFGMLLGDTLILDTLDHANAYRQEIVKHTHCPTILTREGDRVRSNGKFGGLMNKALPIEKLRGAVFGEPLPQAYGEISTQIDCLQSYKTAMNKHTLAKQELAEQVESLMTPEMQAKFKECNEAENQLKEMEKRLGMTATPKRSSTAALVSMVAESSPNKRSRPSGSAVTLNTSINGSDTPASQSAVSLLANLTPTRQSKRIASMVPAIDDDGRKRLRKT
ncbi:hypothetical protein ScPMuIL_009645 [Solemya velum]